MGAGCQRLEPASATTRAREYEVAGGHPIRLAGTHQPANIPNRKGKKREQRKRKKKNKKAGFVLDGTAYRTVTFHLLLPSIRRIVSLITTFSDPSLLR